MEKLPESQIILTDVYALHKAMQGLIADVDSIIKIIVHKSIWDRLQIRNLYKQIYKTNIIDDFRGDLSGNFKTTVVNLFYSPLEFEAIQIRDAICGLIVDEDTLIEIFSSNSSKNMKKIKEAFQKMFKKKLDDLVMQRIEGDLKRIFLSILQCKRPENGIVNLISCHEKAKNLYETGKHKFGDNKEELFSVLVYTPFNEIIEICEEYKKLSGKTLRDSVREEFSGSVRRLLKTMIYISTSLGEYYARRIYKSISGMKTNDKVLIRVIVSRKEIMENIKEEFTRIYHINMIDGIKGDTSGGYRKLLIELINSS